MDYLFKLAVLVLDLRTSSPSSSSSTSGKGSDKDNHAARFVCNIQVECATVAQSAPQQPVLNVLRVTPVSVDLVPEETRKITEEAREAVCASGTGEGVLVTFYFTAGSKGNNEGGEGGKSVSAACVVPRKYMAGDWDHGRRRGSGKVELEVEVVLESLNNHIRADLEHKLRLRLPFH